MAGAGRPNLDRARATGPLAPRPRLANRSRPRSPAALIPRRADARFGLAEAFSFEKTRFRNPTIGGSFSIRVDRGGFVFFAALPFFVDGEVPDDVDPGVTKRCSAPSPWGGPGNPRNGTAPSFALGRGRNSISLGEGRGASFALSSGGPSEPAFFPRSFWPGLTIPGAPGGIRAAQAGISRLKTTTVAACPRERATCPFFSFGPVRFGKGSSTRPVTRRRAAGTADPGPVPRPTDVFFDVQVVDWPTGPVSTRARFEKRGAPLGAPPRVPRGFFPWRTRRVFSPDRRGTLTAFVGKTERTRFGPPPSKKKPNGVTCWAGRWRKVAACLCWEKLFCTLFSGLFWPRPVSGLSPQALGVFCGAFLALSGFPVC